MDFFKLTTRRTEDKVVSTQQRIYDDAISFGASNSFTVKTTSKAQKLRIKFFGDVINVIKITPSSNQNYYIGKYYEMEDGNKAVVFNSSGYFTFTYNCSDNDGNGNFTFNFTLDSESNVSSFTIYISSIKFEDSFYNGANGWLNPTNPNRITSIINEIHIPIPSYGAIGQVLHTTSTNVIGWGTDDIGSQ